MAVPASSPTTAASRRDRLLLAGVFLLSGASALLFETLWFRLAGQVLGASVQAGALVLSSFMGGLALGNGLISRFGRDVGDPVRMYAAMEVLVGVWGVMLVVGFPLFSVWLGALLGPALDRPVLLGVLRLAVAFPLFLLPATAMGVTLPLLVKALARQPGQFGPALGRLYGVNTLGACAGALVGETLLIAPLGLAGTGYFAAGCNLAAALGALAVSGRFREDRPLPPSVAKPRTPLTGRARRLLGAGFLAGGAFLGLEVVWTRYIQLFARSTSLAFAVMLAVILAGIGLGGLVGGWWLKREADGRRLAAPLALVVGAAGLAAFAALGPVSEGLALGPYQTLDWRYVALLSLCLMFPSALASGLLFPALGEAIHREIGDRARSAGLLTMANTLGAMVGPLAVGFLLLPAVGMEKSLVGLCALYPVVAWLCAGRTAPWPGLGRGRLLRIAAVAFVACLAFFPFGATRDHLRRACADYLKLGEVEEATVESVTGTLQYLRRDYLGRPLLHRLVTDGYSMSATDQASQRYMKLFAYFPEVVLQHPASALLICCGTGSTASALVEDKRLKRIDVVDISRDVLAGNRLVHPEPGHNPLDDPRVVTHVEDGRFFLLATGRKYDIITAEPPPPMMAGVVNLYTREYFARMRDRLADGGIVTYWLPVFELSEADAKAILAAFASVFDQAALFAGMNYNWMLVGAKNPAGPRPAADFRAMWDDGALGPGLRAIGVEEPAQLAALFLLDRQGILDTCGQAEPLTDNYPKRLAGYPDSPETQQRAVAAHTKLMDALSARDRFATSQATRYFPAEIVAESPPWFAIQQIVNVFLNNRVTPPPPLQAVNHVLGSTDLRVLPLLLMQSDPARQAIVTKALAAGLAPTAETEFQLGVRALAERDYAKAEAHLRQAQRLGYPGNLAPARVYILCLAGELSEAETLAREAFTGARNNPGARSYLDWLSRTFGLTLPF